MSTIHAANQGDNDSVSTKKGDQDLLDRIRHRKRYHIAAWKDVRAAGDVNMQALSPQGPWDPTDRADRKDAKRPCIHLDQLTQYVNGFMGEAEQSPLAVKVNPAGGGATDKTAELRGNRIRQIEYESNATQATLTALRGAVERSYGAFALTLDYRSWDSDELQIKYVRFSNPDLVSWDPDFKEADASDMQDAFLDQWMPFDDFKKQFGEDATVTNFGSQELNTAPDWIDYEGKQVLVSEYRCIEKKPREILYLQDGSPKGKKQFLDELPEGAEVQKDEVVYADGSKVAIQNRRKTEQPKVMSYITNGIEILDRTELPGIDIAVFPVCGPERWIREGERIKRLLYSYITLGIDAQMLFDYYKTNEAEEVGLTPKPKYAGYKGQFGDGEDYKAINTSTDAFVEFEIVTDPMAGTVLPLPRWDSYTPNIQALEVGSEAARRAIQAALGSYGFTRLDDTNVKSGKAVSLLDKKGDVASYPFVAAYKLAVQRSGRVIDSWLDAIEGEDPLEVGIRTEGGQHSIVKINQPSQDPKTGQQQLLRYSEGADARHDVTISAGPSYQSQRDAANDFGTTLVQSDAPWVPQIIDLIMRLKEPEVGPIASEMADRLTPPQFKKPGEGGPDPAQLQQQLQQITAQHEQLVQALNDANQKLESKQLELDAKAKMQAYSDDVKLAIAAETSKNKLAADQLSAFMVKMDHTLQMIMQERDHTHEAAMAAGQSAADQQQQEQQLAAAADQQQQEPASEGQPAQ